MLISFAGFKDTYNIFRQDKLLFTPTLFSLLMIIFSFVIFLFKKETLPHQVPLNYSLPWGEEQLVPAVYLLILPLSSLIVFIFNIFWSFFFIKRDIFLAKIIAFANLVVAFLSFYTMVRIIFLIS